MATEVTALFNDPESLAAYLGENIGTHFAAALRAADAYARHLAGNQHSLRAESFPGAGLGAFWRDLVRAEEIRIGSPEVLKQLATKPRYYFAHFLDTADAVYGRSYEDVPQPQRKKLGHTQHAQCLSLLRDPDKTGMPDRFAVHNQVTLWSQMFKITTGAPN